MARLKRTEPATRISAYIPDKLKILLDQHLFDMDAGRVPGNAYTLYLTALIRQDLAKNKNLVNQLKDLANG